MYNMPLSSYIYTYIQYTSLFLPSLSLPLSPSLFHIPPPVSSIIYMYVV